MGAYLSVDARRRINVVFRKNTIKVEIIQNGHNRSSVLIIGDTAAIIDMASRVFQHLER